jgi:hypothetical protein
VHRASSDPDDWNRSIQAFPPLCCKCMFQMFSRFKSMLQWFHRDVAKIDRGCCTCCICCKCFRGILQTFIQNVLSILNIRCKRFDLDVCICFTHMLQQHVPYVSPVLNVFCNYLDVAYVTMTMLQVYVLNIHIFSIVFCNFSSECCKSRSQCMAV